MGSAPLKEAGIASGANSALRELGGVLGVAVLASVFARLWVAVGFSGLGFVAALFTAGRRQDQQVHDLAPAPAAAPAVALEGEAA